MRKGLEKVGYVGYFQARQNIDKTKTTYF